MARRLRNPSNTGGLEARRPTLGVIAIPHPREAFSGLSRLLSRLLILASAVTLASVLSGAIFHVVPDVSLAHTRGESMEPGFKNGDLLLIRAAGPAMSLREGDVILFKIGPLPTTHRIQEIRTEGRVTLIIPKGDNNPIADSPITPDQVQGKVITEVPLLGHISRVIGAGGGYYVYHYAALALSLALVLTYVAVTLWRGLPPDESTQNRL
ncbi:MAG TPA: signal peptidase I [Dehalococcoidia bacterium]|nr:signal peptidase I [Dehalococcoidia bacterium]